MRSNKNILVELKNVKKEFIITKTVTGKPLKIAHAVDRINLSIYEGETIGAVSESECGKSTLGRPTLRLVNPTLGQALYKGNDITKYNKEQMHQMRKKMQLIFQDLYASLNPRMTVPELIKVPLDAFGTGSNEERTQKIKEIMELVDMSESMMNRYPHELSRGQRQRIVIVGALVLDPEFVVYDESASALDMSVCIQVLNLIQDLQKTKKLIYLSISHDLSVVKHVFDRVAAVYLGRIVETTEKDEFYNNPQHLYTKALLSAIPIPDVDNKMRREILTGDVPSLLNPPRGCYFHTRRKYAAGRCSQECPKPHDVSGGHTVSCHLCE